MTIPELAKECHISRQSAWKRVHKYEEELEEYLIRDPKDHKILGINDEGIEPFRNLGHKAPVKYEAELSGAVAQAEALTQVNAELRNEVKMLSDQLKTANETISKLQDSMAVITAALKPVEPEQPKQIGFFGKIFGRK